MFVLIYLFSFHFCIVLLRFDILLHSLQIEQNQIIKWVFGQWQSLFLNDNAQNVIVKLSYLSYCSWLYFSVNLFWKKREKNKRKKKFIKKTKNLAIKNSELKIHSDHLIWEFSEHWENEYNYLSMILFFCGFRIKTGWYDLETQLLVTREELNLFYLATLIPSFINFKYS